MRGLIFVVAALAACGGNGPDDDGGGSGSGIGFPDASTGETGTPLSINWTMRVAGQSVNCAQMGAEQIQVTIRPEQGQSSLKLFQCVLVPGTVMLPAGRYAIEAILTGDNYWSAPAQAVTMPTNQALTFAFSR